MNFPTCLFKFFLLFTSIVLFAFRNILINISIGYICINPACPEKDDFVPEGLYLLYNENGKTAFVGMNESFHDNDS